jgi:thiol-disulfide isomerase/thioredoxin
VLKKILFAALILFSIGYLTYTYWYIPYQVNERIAVKDAEGNQLHYPLNNPFILVYIQSWCKDCVAEVPCLMKFSKANDIPIYLVTDEDSSLMKKFKGRFEYDIPIYYTKSKLRDNGILKFPTAYFYDIQKELIDVKLERIDSAVLTRYLGKIKK